MNIFLLILFIIVLIGIKIYPIKNNEDYLSKECTSCIKGLFVLIVFFSHIRTYMPYDPAKDRLMIFLLKNLGQLMVTPFLFYSGYGILESIKSKKNAYIDTIPKNRLLKTLIHFDIVVLSFAFMNYVIGYKNSLFEIITSLTGWNSLGNSNWYIFSILILYLITYIAFKIFKNNNRNAIILCSIITLTTMFLLSFFKEPYWYNTMLCYPLGMFYSYYKDKIFEFLKNNKLYYPLFIFLIIIFFLVRKISTIHFMCYGILTIIFVLIVVLLTFKVKIYNKMLKWLGDYLFYVYILQRIPMIALSRYGFSDVYPYIYIIICFIITIILTIIYSKVFDKMDKKIFAKSN